MLFNLALPLLSLPLALSLYTSSNIRLHTRADSGAFAVPADDGGSQLDDAGNGLGEPLNVIISGLSSSGVLTDDGIVNWARSVGFSEECLGQHIGAPQQANLGDGNGPQDQISELRQDFGDPVFGTCLESLSGGNHFRYWRQNGPEAPTGALFLAVSQEENITENHTIAPNGYDVGRDAMVQAATAGQTTFNGVTYSATAEMIPGLIAPGSQGINHDIATDGNVALLTITIV